MSRGRSSYASRGWGERLSELIVWIALIVALGIGARWYFIVNPSTPGYALSTFLDGVRDGDPAREYKLLATSTKVYFPTVSAYSKGFALAHGIAGRVNNYTISKVTVTSINSRSITEKAEADVNMTIQRANQQLYQDKTDNYKDHYFMVKENDGWKIVLEKSRLNSIFAASQH
jgi:hypothetical protein